MVTVLIAFDIYVLRVTLLFDDQCDGLLDQAFDLPGLVVGVAEVEAGDCFGAGEALVARAITLLEARGFGDGI